MCLPSWQLPLWNWCYWRKCLTTRVTRKSCAEGVQSIWETHCSSHWCRRENWTARLWIDSRTRVGHWPNTLGCSFGGRIRNYRPEFGVHCWWLAVWDPFFFLLHKVASDVCSFTAMMKNVQFRLYVDGWGTLSDRWLSLIWHGLYDLCVWLSNATAVPPSVANCLRLLLYTGSTHSSLSGIRTGVCTGCQHATLLLSTHRVSIITIYMDISLSCIPLAYRFCATGFEKIPLLTIT